MTFNPAHQARLEAIESHFAVHLGSARGRATVETSSGPVEVRRYEPVPGSHVLGTLGVSLLGGPAREAVTVIPAEASEPVLAAACGLMGAFASLPALAATDFTPSPHVFSNLHFEVGLLLPPKVFTDGLSRLETEDGSEVQVVWLAPGFEEEATYARAHGSEALLHLFEAQRLDLANFERPPASTLVSPEDAARMAGAAEPGSSASGRGYRVEQVRGGVRIERRRKRIGRTQTTEQVSVVSPAERSARKPPPSTAPKGASRRARVRFDLNDAAPESTAAPVPQPPPKPEPPEDPVEVKRRKVAELKERAAEARTRAEARSKGETSSAKPDGQPPPAAAQRSRAVLAAERRRGRKAAVDRPSRGGSYDPNRN